MGPEGDLEVGLRLDLVKTATFAVLHFGVGFAVAYLLTGSVTIPAGVALIEPAVNTVVFFFHEKAWRRFGSRLSCEPSPSPRSEEHTSELQSLMRISYAVFCLKKKKTNTNK